jgi:hypothetical protein
VLKGNELQTSGSLSDAKLEVGPTAVTGNIVPWGGKEETIADHKVAFNIDFNAPIARRFPIEKPVIMGANAKKLGPGGGAPGKAWIEEKCKAPKLPKDPKEAEAFLAKEGALPSDEDLKKMPQKAGHTMTRSEWVKTMIELANAMSELQPKDCKVLGGLQDGDFAIIQVQGTSFKIREETDVTMMKDAAKGWKVKKEGAWRTVASKK